MENSPWNGRVPFITHVVFISLEEKKRLQVPFQTSPLALTGQLPTAQVCRRASTGQLLASSTVTTAQLAFFPAKTLGSLSSAPLRLVSPPSFANGSDEQWLNNIWSFLLPCSSFFFLPHPKIPGKASRRPAGLRPGPQCL